MNVCVGKADRPPGAGTQRESEAMTPALTVEFLPTDRIHANDYNPNHMSDEAFAELVAEVRHLGRLPKPVVVRPDGASYVIIDGEHSWRAARETGLAKVSCEVIDADDFESMRQTYKRNRHGNDDSVRLGRMFRQMVDARDLSQRALAKEIEVSEGTIRNALVYAEATDMRNGYAQPLSKSMTRSCRFSSRFLPVLLAA